MFSYFASLAIVASLTSQTEQIETLIPSLQSETLDSTNLDSSAPTQKLAPTKPNQTSFNLKEFNSTGLDPIELAPATLDQTQLAPAPVTLSQKTPQPARPLVEYTLRQEIRSLPGELNEVPVFNSNSPEVVRESGILLSTFPTLGKRYPKAHLNYELKGRFDIFAHHIAKSDTPENTPTLYFGILIKNASDRKRNVVNILQGASFLGTPDAPYITLPQQSPNDRGNVFSGPGDRVSSVLLRGQRQANWPRRIDLDPGESVMIMNLPVPLPTIRRRTPPPKPQHPLSKSAQTLVRPATNRKRRAIIFRPPLKQKSPFKSVPSSNARSTLLRVTSKRDVYVASMALSAPLDAQGRELIPTKDDWEQLLQQGNLVSPRDIEPSPLNSLDEKFFYGRVAGISQGSEWTAQLTDKPRRKKLTIPAPGEAISYGIGTLQRGTFATGQVQSAPILVRYPDTALLAHGNYGVQYNLTLPLYNNTEENRKVQVLFHTPVKTDRPAKGLRFFRNPPSSIFFRGTVRVRYNNDQGTPLVQYFHLVHRRGERGQPLITLNLEPKTSRLVTVDFIYPPDATPPQVLTIRSSR